MREVKDKFKRIALGLLKVKKTWSTFNVVM